MRRERFLVFRAIRLNRHLELCRGANRLNMAGSVPDAADFIVTDPVQAGVMTVMAVADTATFNVAHLKRRIF